MPSTATARILAEQVQRNLKPVEVQERPQTQFSEVKP
jgi:hypothetical protein